MSNCIVCSKKLNNRQSKYCSHECQKEFEYLQYIERWKKGLEDGMRGRYQLSKHIRKYMLKKYNNKCSKCGWGKVNPHTNTVPLEIEHIDGDYTNNSEDNLDVLCPNCHSLTATYKGANKGNGRQERLQYYEYAH